MAAERASFNSHNFITADPIVFIYLYSFACQMKSRLNGNKTRSHAVCQVLDSDEGSDFEGVDCEPSVEGGQSDEVSVCVCASTVHYIQIRTLNIKIIIHAHSLLELLTFHLRI